MTSKLIAPIALVDTGAYERNLKTIAKLCGDVRVMAVLKADAYGHGLIAMARAAVRASVDILGVLDIETALQVHAAGIKVAQFAWLHSPQSNFAAAIDAGVELSASSIEELDRIANAGFGKVHLKIDTGLNRNGATVGEWPELIEHAERLQSDGRIQVVAVWSHLADAGSAEDQAAIDIFDWAWRIAQERGVGKYRHLASSPSAFALPSVRFELVRIGISAFGVSPVANTNRDELGLEPVMTLAASVLIVGSGRAELSIGFENGLFSSLAGFGDARYRILEVTAQTTVIETQQPLKLGEAFELFGKHTDIQLWADYLETVPDELFAALWVVPKQHLTD